MPWKEKAKLRRQQQAESIPRPWRLERIPSDKDSRPLIESSGILSTKEISITNTLDAREILHNLKTKKWTSEEVATAFCKRAAVAQQLTGCCTEMMFEAAIERGKELDEYLAQNGKLFGPLHGIPLSVKDNQDVGGVDTTVGWVGLIGKPAPADVLAVQQWRALGAVIYCKTNIPQSLMMSDSYNHVFGQSVNSLHRELISGGSSGGEGAIVGARASVLGIGTDIGGSIRIPAVLQGLYGLSPTIGRVPNRESGRSQKYVVPPVAGPMATSLPSIELFMESYLDSRPWLLDPQIFPIPWRKELTEPPKRPLKIGYIIDDGVVRCQPPIERAVREVVAHLQNAGHEVIEWDCSTHKHAYYELWLKAVLADGGQRCADLCKIANEPLIEGMIVGTPDTLLDTAQRQALAEKIWDYQHEYLQRWKDTRVDAIIAPVTPWVGMKPKTWVKSDQYCGYTAMYNLLNYAALTIPVTEVSRDLDQPDDSWKSHRGRSFTDQFNHDLYDLDMVNGIPVGVQVIAGRFGEEMAVAVAKVIKSMPA